MAATPKKTATGKGKGNTTITTSPRTRGPQFEPRQVADTLRQAHGLVATAARMLKVERTTIYDYINRYPEVAEAKDEAREFLIDLGEIKLAEAVKGKEPWAVSLLLKTLGRNRGYVERVEQTGKDGGAIEVKSVNYRDAIAPIAAGSDEDSSASG